MKKYNSTTKKFEVYVESLTPEEELFKKLQEQQLPAELTNKGLFIQDIDEQKIKDKIKDGSVL